MHILRIFSVSAITAAMFSNLYLLDTEAGGECNMHWLGTNGASVLGLWEMCDQDRGRDQKPANMVNTQQSLISILKSNWNRKLSKLRNRSHGTKGKQGQLGNILFTNMEIGVGHNHGMATLMESMAHWLEIGFQNYQRGTTVPLWGSPKKEHWYGNIILHG